MKKAVDFSKEAAKAVAAFLTSASAYLAANLQTVVVDGVEMYALPIEENWKPALLIASTVAGMVWGIPNKQPEADKA